MCTSQLQNAWVVQQLCEVQKFLNDNVIGYSKRIYKHDKLSDRHKIFVKCQRWKRLGQPKQVCPGCLGAAARL